MMAEIGINIQTYDEQLVKLASHETTFSNPIEFIKLIQMIEMRIQYHAKFDDLVHFSQIVDVLDLPEEDKSRLRSMRNKTAHSVQDQWPLDSQTILWFKDVVLPSVLRFKIIPDNRPESVFEKKVYEMLEENLDDRWDIRSQVKFGTVVADAVIKSAHRSVIVEAKYLDPTNYTELTRAFDYLQTSLAFTGYKFGILFIPGKILRKRMIQTLSPFRHILVFGINSDFEILKEWLEDTHPGDRVIPEYVSVTCRDCGCKHSEKVCPDCGSEYYVRPYFRSFEGTGHRDEYHEDEYDPDNPPSYEDLDDEIEYQDDDDGYA